MEGAEVAALTNLVAMAGVMAMAAMFTRGTGRAVAIGIAVTAMLATAGGMIELAAPGRGMTMLTVAGLFLVMYVFGHFMAPTVVGWWRQRLASQERRTPSTSAGAGSTIYGFDYSYSPQGEDNEDDDEDDWIVVDNGSGAADGLREPVRAGHGVGSGADGAGTVRSAAGPVAGTGTTGAGTGTAGGSAGESGRSNRDGAGASVDGERAGTDGAGNGVAWRPAVAAADRGGRPRGRRLLVAVPAGQSADRGSASDGIAAGAIGDGAAA